MKVKVKERTSDEVIAGCGKRKALFTVQSLDGVWYTVSVVRYKESDYFLIEYNGIPKECMPL